MRRRGFPTSRNASSHPRLGLLTSKSGPGSLFATSIDNAAMLALEEINAEGGIHGSPVELIVGDDATDPQTGVMEARRLVQAGCRTILVAATSATYTAVAEALSDAPVLLVQPVMNEGGRGDRLRLQLGERPGDQLAAAVKPLMRMEGVRRWFLAGDDYCWPRTTHGLARQLLPRYGARVVGEKFASLGTRDFARSSNRSSNRVPTSYCRHSSELMLLRSNGNAMQWDCGISASLWRPPWKSPR